MENKKMIIGWPKNQPEKARLVEMPNENKVALFDDFDTARDFIKNHVFIDSDGTGIGINDFDYTIISIFFDIKIKPDSSYK